MPGRVLNQFSMDEYNGFFRIATTVWSGSPKNSVYVLDAESLEIVGKLEGLAVGERIYSARFVGDKCYLVTFKKVDPFFVIDLSLPHMPRVLGWLKIPGFSTYLHPINETLILGIGKETVEAKTGNFAWFQGVKISLFDVSNFTNPREVSRIVIGDRGSDTPVLRNHRAFVFDKRYNLIYLPVIATKKPSGLPPYMPGSPAWQGVYVIRIAPNNLTIDTRLSCMEMPRRIVYIGEYLYALSDSTLLVWKIGSYEMIGKVALS